MRCTGIAGLSKKGTHLGPGPIVPTSTGWASDVARRPQTTMTEMVGRHVTSLCVNGPPLHLLGGSRAPGSLPPWSDRTLIHPPCHLRQRPCGCRQRAVSCQTTRRSACAPFSIPGVCLAPPSMHSTVSHRRHTRLVWTAVDRGALAKAASTHAGVDWPAPCHTIIAAITFSTISIASVGTWALPSQSVRPPTRPRPLNRSKARGR